jgi:hypothetical protein
MIIFYDTFLLSLYGDIPSTDKRVYLEKDSHKKAMLYYHLSAKYILRVKELSRIQYSLCHSEPHASCELNCLTCAVAECLIMLISRYCSSQNNWRHFFH